MLELNLMKESLARAAQVEKASNYFRTAYLVIFLIFAGLAAYSAFLHVQLATYGKACDEKRSAIESNRNAFSVNALEAEWSGYRERLIAIDGVVQNKTLWSVRLRELAAIIPANAYITSLVTEGDKLLLSVVALPAEKRDFDCVKDFMEILKKTKYFSNEVRLEAHQRTKTDNRDTDVFRVSLALSLNKKP